ncbi:response regulator [Bradyrhizobium sp. 44]|uniref:response regulator n=1 Tax=Bradyrhizobium sp. 44 TaxID=2782675 RepID=UPI001FF9F5C6|nr:response regulator [Bradyrhizobium sp. 44]
MSPVKFLLVDDLEENLLSLGALLQRDGLILVKARSADQALELLLEHDFALALIDVQMPGMNGFELAELMRGNERTRRIPIIFVTAGSADGQRRFHGYEAGAVDFIQKPIETDILRSKAEVFFQLYRQWQQIAAQRDEIKLQARALEEAGRRKDESLISLTHDISLQKNARAQQDVLLKEINHRIKNLFSVTAGLIALSAQSATTVEELAMDLRSRLLALSRAHDLTLPDLSSGGTAKAATSVRALLSAILAPHEDEQASRIAISGSDAPLSGNALTSLALLLHELTTNAAKYGALCFPDGRLIIAIEATQELFRLKWEESGATPMAEVASREGFGTVLEKAALNGLGGHISRNWRNNGLSLFLEIPLANLAT